MGGGAVMEDDDTPPFRRSQTPTQMVLAKARKERAGTASGIPDPIEDADSAAIPDPDARKQYRLRRDTHENVVKALTRLDGQDKVLELIQKVIADQFDERRFRRKLILKVASIATPVGAALLEILHRLGVL